ncbi:PAS domain S-box protein [Halogranum rubrum]|uniref:PAS domain S-box protein n=1 Tax=Halogranum rubrum TaxID=553466 RepID=UPI00145CBD89|nr:PAS domain S-box protein [Halogranum salarium]
MIRGAKNSMHWSIGRQYSPPQLSEAEILYVDPDEEAGRLVTDAFEDVAVTVVSTGTEALSVLDEQSIDCLISEYRLPDGDGLHLLEALRIRDNDVPFILYTNAGSETLASRAITAGVSEYIQKADMDGISELIDSIEALLWEQSRREQSSKLGEMQTLVEFIDDYAIFLLEDDGRIASWDSGAENIMGYTRDEVVGEHLSILFPRDMLEQGVPSDLLTKACVDGHATTKGWCVRKNGSRFWAEVILIPHYDQSVDSRRFSMFTRDLTEQQRWEERLRQEHELTTRILSTAPVAIAIHDADGTRRRMNARARDILQITPSYDDQSVEDQNEVHYYTLDGTPLNDRDHPTQQVLASGEPLFDHEVIIERSDDSRVHVSINSVPLFDANGDIEQVITTGQDITELKNRERRLYETQQELEQTVDTLRQTNHKLQITETRFEALTKNSSFAVISIDGSNTIQYANETIEEIFGYDPETLVGSSITRLMPDELAPKHKTGLKRYLETGNRHLDWEWVELPGQHKAGHEIQLGLSFGDISVDGDHLFTGIIRDITEQRDRKQELERRRKELSELIDELERSNAELEQFAYVVSHDLKEPLRMVTSYLQLLEHRYANVFDEDAEEFIGYAIDGADRMRQMIDDLLTYSRVGRDNTAYKPVDCEQVVKDVLSSLPDMDTATITIEDLPTVGGNRSQLVKLFQNLISNAIKHSDTSSASIHISATHQPDNWWCIAVTDDGHGIPPDSHDDIFNLFTSLGDSDGSGIGLSICRKVVEQHGGQIWVDSELGKGTTFFFTLPPCDTAETEHADS